MRLTEKQQKQFAAIRAIMDKVVAAIPMSNESEYNQSAAVINENSAAIRIWVSLKNYKRGDLRVSPVDGVPYWAMHDHSSVEGAELEPNASPTIWAHCHGTTPETARPFVAEGHNPYNMGHYCVENGVVARCKQDGTVHAPSVLPSAWEIVEV